MKMLDRLFGKAEEINGANRCDTYLYRWLVLTRFKSIKVYLHHFVGDDWSRDLHDHPKRFISIGLWGWYREVLPCPFNTDCGCNFRIYRAPWIRSFPAEHIHRLVVPNKNTWTLVVVLKPVREWGFWHEGTFIHWKQYVYGKSKHVADEMRDC